MNTIKSKDELLQNIKTLDEYLNKEEGQEYEFALNLIKRGTCFIVVKNDDNYKFYPSRFIGYSNNTMYKHQNNYYKDGRVTNAAINDIFGYKPIVDVELDEKYKNYCNKLGFNAYKKGSYGVERKFWNLNN